MQTIPITLAEPGMILDQAILHPTKPSGAPIFGAGKELTSQIIDKLKKIGVQNITVTGHPVNIPGEETMEQALISLDQRFAAVSSNPYMMKIHDLFYEQIKKKFEAIQ